MAFFNGKISSTTIILAILIVVLGGGLVYTWHELQTTSGELATERQTNEDLRGVITTREQTISEQDQTNNLLSEALQNEQDKVASISDDLEELTDTVGTLDKLSKLDPELLQKYSKVYFLNEHYQPSGISQIDKEYYYDADREYHFHSKALRFLHDMLEEAEDDGINLRVVSAFRSFDTQGELKAGYVATFGSGANAFSADQGYSEHQLGTTIDFVAEGGTPFIQFAATPAYAWLQENAYKYGFILSYPENNEYYQFEPWHWRFVGRDLARDLDRKDEAFYDLPQREIDEYLLEIFD